MLSYTLKWYIVMLLTICMFFLSLKMGILQMIWLADVTKLSFLILSIFFIATAKCGYDIFNFERGKDVHGREVELGWFVSESLLALGMTGTVIGFIIIMKDFAFVDVSDVNSVQELIKSLGAGISTALYTTLTGLIASLMLKVQYFLLEDAIEKNEI